MEKKLTGAGGGRVRFWRCRSERAQAQAVAAEAEALLASGVAPEEICVLVRSVKSEGASDRVRARGARRAIPDLWRGRLLPARRGARPARLAARAGRSKRLRRGGACAQPASDRAAFGGRRTPHPAGQTPQARHALGRGGRPRGAAALRGGPRPRPLLPAALPLRLQRLSRAPPGRLRDAADRAHRSAPPTGVRHSSRHGRAAAQHRQAARARHRLHAPRAASDGPRVRALPGGGGGVRPARGGGGRPALDARRLDHDHARGKGPRVRPRLRARPDRRRHARPVSPARRRRSGRAAQGTPRSGGGARRRTRTRCAACCTWR